MLQLLEPSDTLGHRPIAHAQAVGRCEPTDVPISPVQGIGVRCIPQLVAPIDARVGGLHPRDERSRHLDSGGSRPMGAPRPGQRFCATSCGICIHIEESLRIYIGTIKSTRSQYISQAESFESFAPKRKTEKGSMVGFISNLAPLLNYLRRRSPGPPFPPDHRQAGERGAIRLLI